jgi:hypothetical protein
MRIGFAAAILVATILGACAGIKGVSPGMSFDAGDGVTVQSDVAWANVYGPGISGYLWTIDGFGLNEMRFLTAVAPGKPLMQVAGVKTDGLGTYSGDMLPNDVMEFVGNNLAKAGNLQLQTTALRPERFGSAMGFRFDLSFVNSDGLQMKGTALFAQRQGKLDLILFLAPAEFYYDHNLPVVERVFGSIRVASKM